MSSSVSASFAAAFGKYDVVHIHAEGPAFMCWLPKLMGKTGKLSRYTVWITREPNGESWRPHISCWGKKNAVRFADEIIVLSAGVRQYFLDQYKRKTQFIPNGVNQPKKRAADAITAKWGLKKDNYILYLGRIVPEKGETYLIRAFKQVKTDKKLVIAGGSSDTQAFLEQLKQLAKGDERILFTGFVQGRIKHELYSNAYLYTLPSDLEGMPLSLLEGMSYGNCCLTSDIPECAEVVEDKAVLFQKGNVEDLKEKLQMLCDHPHLVQTYKNEAEAFILKKYGWNDAVEKTLALYRA